MQGSAALAVTNTSYAWVGHTAFTDVDGDPVTSPTLTGGSDYYLLVSGGATGSTGFLSRWTDKYQYARKVDSLYYTGGFPETIPGSPSSDWIVQCTRCGVEPATSIKTVSDLAKASVKTVNGLVIASVKTIDGLA